MDNIGNIKVNKVLKANSSSNTISNTDSNSNSNSSSNSIREHEHEHDSLLTEEETEEEKERVLEELTDEELNNLLRRYRGKEKYANLQKDFNLQYGILSKEIPSQIETILKERHKEEIDKKREEDIDRILASSAAFSNIDYDERYRQAQEARKKREEKRRNWLCE